MRRALRIALKTVTWVAIVGCTGMLVVVLINLRDEALTPEAQSLAEYPFPTSRTLTLRWLDSMRPATVTRLPPACRSWRSTMPTLQPIQWVPSEQNG